MRGLNTQKTQVASSESSLMMVSMLWSSLARPRASATRGRHRRPAEPLGRLRAWRHAGEALAERADDAGELLGNGVGAGVSEDGRVRGDVTSVVNPGF